MIEETRAFAMHLKLLQKDLGLLEERVECECGPRFSHARLRAANNADWPRGAEGV